VVLWGRDQDAIKAMRKSRINQRYLPEIDLSAAIDLTSDLNDLWEVETLLLVVPAQTMSGIFEKLPSGDQPLVICAKGLERSSNRRLSEIVRDNQPQRPVAALSGPNFAREVALGLPAAATLASDDEIFGRQFAAAMSHEQFRVYWTDDIIGVEIGGAVKNVLAIASGIVMGRGFGENAKAALITRGLAELTRLGRALGARPETLTGLSGLGDLLLTAGSLTSRNMAFGHSIGAGTEPVHSRDEPGMLVEGAFTAKAVVSLATHHRIDMPICQAIDAILEGRLSIDRALETLMTRPIGPENPS